MAVRHGRRKGTLNSGTARAKKLAEQALREGITPLEYMLDLIRAPEPQRVEGEPLIRFLSRSIHDRDVRLAAARYAAPYMHARIATTIQLKTPTEQKPLDALELAKSVAFLLEAAENGHTFTVPAPDTQH